MSMTTRAPWARGAAAAVAVGAAALLAAPAGAQGDETRTISVPATLHIESQVDMSPDQGIYSNCSTAVLIRWQAVGNAVPGSIRRVYYDFNGTEQSKIAREPFDDRLQLGGTRLFVAPPGTHQRLVAQGSRSVPNATADCSRFEEDARSLYTALRVEVEVSGAGAPPPPGDFACTLPSRPSSLDLAATVGQLRINQRIAIAAVRRLNAIRARLEARPEPETPSGTERGVIRPTTTQLRINQRISEAGFRRAREIYRELGGTGAPTLTPLASSIRFTRAGVGANQLTNIRALDMLNCINRNLS